MNSLLDLLMDLETVDDIGKYLEEKIAESNEAAEKQAEKEGKKTFELYENLIGQIYEGDYKVKQVLFAIAMTITTFAHNIGLPKSFVVKHISEIVNDIPTDDSAWKKKGAD